LSVKGDCVVLGCFYKECSGGKHGLLEIVYCFTASLAFGKPKDDGLFDIPSRVSLCVFVFQTVTISLQ
jgi:hypothetical protein